MLIGRKKFFEHSSIELKGLVLRKWPILRVNPDYNPESQWVPKDEGLGWCQFLHCALKRLRKADLGSLCQS